ncbi:hypothetical protein MNAN1_000058 [Malassezia nana]|uniref:Amino acid permease/ SLC12A domain-containing protein n=1 Tax=Malassezia nana TaxID=180528 RepID=A0AAF0EG92_9BASI|nr:hypothetical protein MNAN1_000058 [Malassezia nana]
MSQSNMDTSYKQDQEYAPKDDFKRDLDARHLAFLALGSGIGTGLFIGSGNILSSGGPGSLMIDFIILAIMVVTVIFAVGEMLAAFPFAGTYSSLLSRFVDPSMGFAVGLNYLLTWLIILPVELTAATMIIGYWDPQEHVPRGVWVAIILVFVFLVNLFGVRIFGEVEFFITAIKMLAIVGFIICAVVINCGGTPSKHYFGADTWHDPGAFANGFKGFSNAFAFAALAYGGSEIIGITAGEARHPQKHLPRACKYIVYRVIIFFILSLFMVTLLVPYDEPALQGSSSNPRASPFVIAIKKGGIYALPSIFNAVILMSVISVANASVYTGSRLVHSMAKDGFLPRFLMFQDSKGRPWIGYLVVLLFGLLGFLVYSTSENEVFNWLGSITGLSVILLWATLCMGHIRFRQAWKSQGHSLDELPWRSPLGQIGSWFGAVVNVLVLMATFYTSAFPIGEGDMDANERTETFFQSYLSVVIILFSFFVHKLVTRSSLVKLRDMDLVSGFRPPEPDDVLQHQHLAFQARPRWKKALEFLF